jgi:2OG-Fe(II) oxygenase superfamily/WD domain, G-beta repeat
MDNIVQIQSLLPGNNFTCFIVPSLFTKIECESLLPENVRTAFEKAISNYPTYYRNNDRLQIDNEELANALFEKVKVYLPQRIQTNSSILSENGEWQLSKLNERLRYCKYSANQYFHRHLDGVYYRSESEQSKLTFMIYLNGADEFEGGRTLFYQTKNSTEILASYIPQQGDLIVFDHNVWHEGEVLTNGEKFVLRSDILYKKSNLQNDIDFPFKGHLGYIWKILQMDSDTILSCGRDKNIHVWTEAGILKQSLVSHKNSIIDIEKISNTSFITSSRDRTIKIWNKNFDGDFVLCKTLKIHEAIVLSLCKLYDNLFASGGGDGKLNIVTLDGIIKNTLEEHSNWIWDIVKLKDNFLASCSEDCTIKIWDYLKARSIVTLVEKVGITVILFIETKNLIIYGNLLGEIFFREMDENFDTVSKIKIDAHQGIVRTLVQIDEKRIASGGEDNKVKIWNIETGVCIDERIHENFVQSIALLENGDLLSASYDGTIKRFEINY